MKDWDSEGVPGIYICSLPQSRYAPLKTDIHKMDLLAPYSLPMKWGLSCAMLCRCSTGLEAWAIYCDRADFYGYMSARRTLVVQSGSTLSGPTRYEFRLSIGSLPPTHVWLNTWHITLLDCQGETTGLRSLPGRYCFLGAFAKAMVSSLKPRSSSRKNCQSAALSPDPITLVIHAKCGGLNHGLSSQPLQQMLLIC